MCITPAWARALSARAVRPSLPSLSEHLGPRGRWIWVSVQREQTRRGSGAELHAGSSSQEARKTNRQKLKQPQSIKYRKESGAGRARGEERKEARSPGRGH